MKKIVIIGANEFQEPLIRKAGELGLQTHVFAWEQGAVGAEYADCFYPISIVEKEKILEVCQRLKPDAIASIGSDLAGITVQYVAEALGLPCNTGRCIDKATNKFQMRRAFREAGIPTPQFVLADKETDWERVSLDYPVIVKPTDRSGSRGIRKVYQPTGLREAVELAAEQSFEKKAIVEGFLEGEEYSLENISYLGKHWNLAVTKKFTTGAPHYIEVGHIEPSGLSGEMEQKLVKEVFRALDALEITMGASHAEVKLSADGRVQIIEIGARMGGDCIGSHLVQLSTGYDYVGMVIDTALGREPKWKKAESCSAAAVRFIFNEQDKRQLDRLKQDYPDRLAYVSEITMGEESSVTDSGTRFGYYILKCQSREEALILSDLGDEEKELYERK